MFGEPRDRELKILAAKTTVLENAVTNITRELQAERTITSDLRQALRNRQGTVPYQRTPTAAPAAAPSAPLHEDIDSLQTAISAVRQERDDAIAAASVAHADAERAQLREQKKAAELAAAQAALEEASCNADISRAVFNRSMEADSAEQQVQKLQQTSSLQQENMAAVMAKLSTARAEADATDAQLREVKGHLAAQEAAVSEARQERSKLGERLKAAIQSLEVLQAKHVASQQCAADESAGIQASLSALQNERDALVQQAGKHAQQVESLQAAIIAKDKRLDEQKLRLEAQDVQCRELMLKSQDLRLEAEQLNKQVQLASRAADAASHAAEGTVRKAKEQAAVQEASLDEARSQSNTAHAAAAAAHTEALRAREAAGVADARATALEAARFSEERKAAGLQADLNRMADESDAQVKASTSRLAQARRIAELEGANSAMQARLGVADQLVAGVSARSAELSEARSALSAKLAHISALRHDVDERTADNIRLARERDAALRDLAAMVEERPPTSARRMSHREADSADRGEGWPSPADYLAGRGKVPHSAMSPHSPIAEESYTSSPVAADVDTVEAAFEDPLSPVAPLPEAMSPAKAVSPGAAGPASPLASDFKELHLGQLEGLPAASAAKSPAGDDLSRLRSHSLDMAETEDEGDSLPAGTPPSLGEKENVDKGTPVHMPKGKAEAEGGQDDGEDGSMGPRYALRSKNR